MKSCRLVIPVCLCLQLVNVVAGNDVTTFNQQEFDEDNIESALKTEHFIEVVDRRFNRPPQNSALRTPKLYQNSSHFVSSQETHQRSIEEKQRDSIQTRLAVLHSNRSSSNEFPLAAGRSHEGGPPSARWEDMTSMVSDLDFEDTLQEIDSLFRSNDKGYNSEKALSRYRRAAECRYSSGDMRVQGQFDLTEKGSAQRVTNLDKYDISVSLTQSLQSCMSDPIINAQVTLVQYRTVSFEVSYDECQNTRKEVASCLNTLDINDNFRVGSAFYAVSRVMLQDENKVWQYVICFLCASYQTCQPSGMSQNYVCKLRDTNLYPFGQDQYDKTVPPNDEFVTADIRLTFPIPYGNELVDTVHISVNGLISFGEKFSSYTPTTCTVYNSKRQKIKMLAPYWADLESIRGDPGQVYYQVYTRGASPSNMTRSILERATRDVWRYTYDRNFEASVVIVATWSDVPAYPLKRINNERVTFQAVIISDGQTSYVMYFYAQRAMGFNPALKRAVQVCVRDMALDRSRNNFYIFDTIIGNTGSRGIWMYQLGYYPNSQAKCNRWFQENVPNLSEIDFWNIRLPACPCDEFSAWISFMWIPSVQRHCYDLLPWFGPWYAWYGRRCCYSGGNFENRMPRSGNFQTFSPLVWWRNAHEQEDAVPKRWCCYESNLCYLYYRARPVGRCEPRWSSRGNLFGDPHFKTLDQSEITFNGLGEYRVLEVNKTMSNTSENNFKLQARTCRAKSSNGSLSDATVFCALALHNTNGTSARVSVHPSGSYMVIYINGQDFTARFRDSANFSSNVNGIFMQKLNDSLRLSTPDEIGLTVNLLDSMLDFSVEVSNSLRNSTMGLLGNFNGDPSDDFTFPNGTVLQNTSRQRAIFEYGQTWAVQESIFVYENGENSSTYADPNFIPIFLDEVSNEEIAKAKAVCGNLSSSACIYDYVATQNDSLAKQTKTLQEEFDQVETILSNNPPNINEPPQLNVTVNQTSSLTFYGSDPDNDTFRFDFVDQPNIGVFSYAIDSNQLTANYTPTNLTAVSIGVRLVDNKNLSSEVSQVNIVACSGCSGNGSCDFSNVVTSSENQYFSIAVCDCWPGYSGDDCENDKDGCDNNPCPYMTNCTDVSADVENATGISFNCTDCPQGYFLNGTNATKCEDIDECSLSVSPCDPNADCINTIGGYSCECKQGFRNSSAGKCIDINECVENQYNCSQQCINTVPFYNCSCYEGFTHADVLSIECIKTNIDPCQNLTEKNCTYGCKNASGIAECFCNTGYKLKADNVSCEDINECDENLCSQQCSNTNGSYICSCLPGYELSVDKQTCIPCMDNRYGDQCQSICECRGHGIGCDHIKGCVCERGWTGQNCSDDVDECLPVSFCPKDMLCINNPGGYSCECPSGYRNENNSCVNINECADANGNCSQICIDNTGSFSCACRDGYKAVDNQCLDIDECALGISGCEQKCRNMDGSFNCECNPGFALDYDRRKCVKENNPCQDFNVTCDYACYLEAGSPKCFCQIGFMLGTDSKTCVDIDECSDRSLNNCTDQCVNKQGSYICSCLKGRKLANDNRTCQDCDSYHWGPNCTTECACNPVGNEKCDPVKGCMCKAGWGGYTCYDDENECSLNATVCPEFSQCTNSPGSFVCTCNSGFQYDGHNCSDIDECITNPCDYECNNTIGGYTCSCPKGFYVNGTYCIDIDECAVTSLSNCDQRCRNTQGGYACECYEGYILNTTNRNTCYRDPSAKDCGIAKNCSLCELQDGKETCVCRPGFEIAPDNFTCQDVECLKSPCDGNCTNLNGSFACSCDAGMKLAPDHTTCQVCDPWFYGHNCSNACSCNVTTTQSCIPSNGTCLCSKGWSGLNCSEDIDECLDQAINSSCGNGSRCVNTPGSYKCVCEDGFFPTSDGLCKPCDATHYGQDCRSTCTCMVDNTADCNNVNGTCTCKTGWNGTNCDLDINECDMNSSYCEDPEQCHNLNGSAECRCKDGYRRPNPGDRCQDVNECLVAGLHNCTQPGQECNNTIGSYNCFCGQGYRDNNSQCIDIDECKDPSLNTCNNATSQCRNTAGRFECDCKDGYDKNNKGDECHDINECLVAGLHNCTGYGQECNNTVGSYNCVCGQGYRDNNSQCIDIDECKDPSLNTCNNATTTCRNTDGGFECDCKDGYGKNSTGDECQDINECLVAGLHNCTGYGQECNNTVGSYNCVCGQGYRDNNSQCIDIDECKDPSLNTCNNATSKCRNTDGGFKCDCKDGYGKNSTGDECQDINECMVAALHNCTGYGQECNNTVGSYNCVCGQGYRDNNSQCIDIDECKDPSLNTCNNATSKCRNTDGGFECDCKDGYGKNSTGDECQDIDECQKADLHNCTGAGQECNNTVGSYNCFCGLGYQDNNSQCIVIQGYQVQITLLYTASEITSLGFIFNSSTEDFRKFAKIVEDSLIEYAKSILPSTTIEVQVSNFYQGSVVANTTVYFKTSSNTPGDAAKLVYRLNTDKTLKVGNDSVKLGGVTIEHSNSSDGLCDIYKGLGGSCPNASCEDEFECQKQADRTDRTNLIIGLAVGIPLFIILAVIVGIVACLYARRKNKSIRESNSVSVDHAAPFRNVMPTRTSTKGSWGAPHQMYTPDNLSETGTNESGIGGLIKTRQKGRPDFQDSAWYDNRLSNDLPESREASTEIGRPTSNFSWEYMFRLLEPHKDFEIQRPFYETAPNPTFVSKNKPPDSTA